jgi:hypothetical protein
MVVVSDVIQYPWYDSWWMIGKEAFVVWPRYYPDVCVECEENHTVSHLGQPVSWSRFKVVIFKIQVHSIAAMPACSMPVINTLVWEKENHCSKVCQHHMNFIACKWFETLIVSNHLQYPYLIMSCVCWYSMFWVDSMCHITHGTVY